MSAKQDVKLVEYDTYYDFNLTSAGDIETIDSFDSTIIVSLFADARAEDYEVSKPENRRGWIGNLGYTYQIGSKLWLYSQSRANNTTAQLVRNAVKDALNHYVDSGLVKSIDVTSELISSGVAFYVTIKRFNSKTETRYFELWNNTGK